MRAGIASALLPNHRWLDRIVRGRAWIPLLGVLLVAIVGLRVEVLKLGSSVGRNIEQANTLQSGDQALRSRVSQLSDNQRIEQIAAAMGMVMPGPMDIHFVQPAGTSEVASAINNIRSPSADTFLTGLVSERQADADNATAAANISAVGAQTTNDPGTAVNTGATDTSSSLSSNGTSTATGTGTPTGTSGTSAADSSTGGTSAGSTAPATGSSTATAGTGTATGTPSSGSTTGTTDPTSQTSDATAGTASTQDTGSGSSSGGTGLAG